MPVLVYEGREYRVDERTAAWLRMVAESFERRLKIFEKVLEGLKSQLVEASLDGNRILVPRHVLQSVIARIEREGKARRRRPPIELPIRRPPEAVIEKLKEHAWMQRKRRHGLLLARG